MPTMMKLHILSLSLLCLCPGTQGRALQACNQVLNTWTRTEVSDLTTATLMASMGADQAAGIIAGLSGSIVHGVQIRKICASCTDFDSAVVGEAYLDFCGPDRYGSGMTFSGLAMLPMTADGLSLTTGTLKGYIYAHGTVTQISPSLQWEAENSDLELMFNVLVASAGQPVLLPDYMGYANTASMIHKGYVIKQSYQTSTVPLWLKMEEILSEETDCATALADSFLGIGYSEGGYAILAIADALSSIGVDVIRAHSGGGPLRTASAAILKTIENVDTGRFPPETRHQVALFMGAYSSTFVDVANYQQGQDMLTAEARETIVEVIYRSGTYREVVNTIPENDVLSVVNPDFLAWARSVIASGDANPCLTPEVGFNDLVCQALLDNDLMDQIESTTYNITFCHSPNDRVVDYSNLPGADVLAQNPLLSLIQVTGNHRAAGETCILRGVLSFRSEEFLSYEVTPKHSESGCSAISHSPSSSPSAVEPSSAPSLQSSGVPSGESPSQAPSLMPSPTSDPSTSSAPVVSSPNSHGRNSLGLSILSNFAMLAAAAVMAY